jgi:hypothetical protein
MESKDFDSFLFLASRPNRAILFFRILIQVIFYFILFYDLNSGEKRPAEEISALLPAPMTSVSSPRFSQSPQVPLLSASTSNSRPQQIPEMRRFAGMEVELPHLNAAIVSRGTVLFRQAMTHVDTKVSGSNGRSPSHSSQTPKPFIPCFISPHDPH